MIEILLAKLTKLYPNKYVSIGINFDVYKSVFNELRTPKLGITLYVEGDIVNQEFKDFPALIAYVYSLDNKQAIKEAELILGIEKESL